MSRFLVAAILVAPGLAALAAPSSQTVGSEAAKPDDSEQELRALEAKLNEAIVRADLDFFDRVFAADFTHTNHMGVFRTKAQWLANHKPGEKGPYTSFDTDDLAIRIYGDTAVVTGRSNPKGTNAKGQAITGQFRFLRVWVKRQGRWQVVAFQGTRIATQ